MSPRAAPASRDWQVVRRCDADRSSLLSSNQTPWAPSFLLPPSRDLAVDGSGRVGAGQRGRRAGSEAGGESTIDDAFDGIVVVADHGPAAVDDDGRVAPDTVAERRDDALDRGRVDDLDVDPRPVALDDAAGPVREAGGRQPPGLGG